MHTHDQPVIVYGMPSPVMNIADFLPPGEAFEYGRKNGCHGSVALGARIMLRKILGQWSGIPPSEVEIYSEATGKPQLASSPVNISVAHTHSAYLLAFASPACGVDIDLAPPASIDGNLVAYVCKSNEAQYCREGDPIERFLHIWTGKEAVMKLSGICHERRFKEIDILQGYDSGVQKKFTILGFKCPGNEWGAFTLEGDLTKITPVFIQA